MPFEFSTKPRSFASLPTDTSELINDADSFVSGVKSKWKKGKTYRYNLEDGSKESVDTFGKHINGEYWLARVSRHKASKYPLDRFVQYSLGAKKLEAGEDGAGGGAADGKYVVRDKYQHISYEHEYIHVLSKWGKISVEELGGKDEDDSSPWAATWAEYELGAPLATREFSVFALMEPPSKERPHTAYVVQLVCDRPAREGNVGGMYAAIDRFEYNAKEDSVEWIMCTASDSGGNVPKWLQNTMIAKSVAADVPAFLNWLNSRSD